MSRTSGWAAAPAILLTAILAGALPQHAGLLPADEVRVATPAELQTAIRAAGPGDVIVMADGTWTNVDILFEAEGAPEDSVTLRAETPGRVVLDGTSRLRIAGSYLVVDGLYFRGGEIHPDDGHVIQFRSGSKHAHHSRLTRTAVVDYNARFPTWDYKWVSLYGTHNRVDHSYFAGKTHAGPTLVVWLNDPPDDAPNFHRIDHNYFGPRPPLGANGGETIRIGTSSRSMQDSETLVEANLFEACDGEIEIISNKSGRNVFRGNTFLASAGTLTLRHGNGALVEGNFFLGEGKAGAGGVRVIGEDHAVVNNYFEDLDGTGFRSAVSVMNGVPNSPLNRYFQVKRAVIAFNTIVHARSSIFLGAGADDERTLPPDSLVIANNAVLAGERADFIVRQDDAPTRAIWEGNVFFGASLGIDDPGGITMADPMLTIETGHEAALWRPAVSSPLIDAAAGDYAWVMEDMDGQLRPAEGKDVGADEYLPEAEVHRPLTPADVGPAWLAEALGTPAESDAPGETLRLLPNYPNPFGERTTLTFDLGRPGPVVLRVYDARGRLVAEPVDRILPAGLHRVSLDGAALAPGTYVVELAVGGTTRRRAITQVR